jgi:phosphoribosyl-dephospho-CoA transferase
MIGETNLDARFERTKKFLEYLMSMEEREKMQHPEHQSSPLGRFSFTKNMMGAFEKERQAIYKSWRRSYELDF